MTYADPPNLDFADLEKNYQKRTYCFDLYQKKLEKDNPRLLNWIGSIDYSGYVREQCLNNLIANYQIGDENRILLRLEDWVPQIQKIAEQWILDNFDRLSIKQINLNYRLILYLSRKKRLQNSQGLQFINSCLLKKAEELTRKQFYALNSNFRRYLYLLGVPRIQKLRQWMLFDKDPFNRLLFLKLLSYDRLTQEERDILQFDRSALVKRRVLSFELENDIIPDLEKLITLIVDRSQSVRLIARYFLLEYYNINAYDLYKNRSDYAFYYIADYSKEEDIDYLLDGVFSQNNRIKYICLKAICHIDPNYLQLLDLKQIILENQRIRSLVVRYLPSILSIDELIDYKETLRQATPNGVLIYLNTILGKSYWHFVDQLLSLLIEDMSRDDIAFIRQRLFTQKQVYTSVSLILRTSISDRLNILKTQKDPRLKTIIQKIEFILKNAR